MGRRKSTIMETSPTKPPRRSQRNKPSFEPPPESARLEASEDPIFRSRYHEILYYGDIVQRNIITSQFVNLEENLPLGLDYVEWVKHPHLSSIVSIKLPFYNSIVKVFYSNLSIEIKEGLPIRLRSRVYNHDIDLSIDDLRKVFRSPRRGIVYLGNGSDWDKLHRSEASIIKDIFQEGAAPIPPRRDWLARHLNFQDFILHKILRSIVFPHKSSVDSVSFSQMFYIYGIKTSCNIDYASAILLHMNKTLSRTSYGLPYGSLISFILQRLNIPFYGEPNPPSSCINLTSLHLCQISWNSNNESWYWRGKRQTNLDDEDISSSPPPPPRSYSQRSIPTHSVGTSSSSSSSLSWIKKIFRLIKKNDKKVDTKLGELKEQMDRVERKQQKIYSHLRSFGGIDPDSDFETATVEGEEEDDMDDDMIHSD